MFVCRTAGCRGARGGAPAIFLGLENQSRERLRIANKGLVASLQAVYEPLVGVRVGGEPPAAARLAVSSSSSSSGSAGMLARPWQAGALHGSEPASSPPPLPKSPPQLGAGGSPHPPSIEAFSSSQSRSVSGRSPSRFPSVDVVSVPASTARLVNGANSGSHVAEPAPPLNHYQTPTSTIPSRRFSEPNRNSSSRSSAATMVEETRLKSSAASSAHIDMVDNNRSKMAGKGMHSWKGMTGNRDNEDGEELQYGPGIVNKLKSRYLSRTLRERPLGESRRPSLRRAASLEDWLDKDSSPPHPAMPTDVLVRSANGRAKTERPVSLNLAAQTVVESKPPPSASPVKVRDLKKTRSVDFVSQPAWRSVSVSDLVISPPQQPKIPAQTQAAATAAAVPAVPASPITPVSPKTPVHLLLSKDAIVIVEKDGSQVDKIETKPGNLNTASPTAAAVATVASSASSKTRRISTNTRYNVEDAELPAPDTVRQVKRIFESGSSRKTQDRTRRSQSAGPGLNRIPLSAANQSSTDKMNIHRMNQVNLVNNKSVSSVARKKSDTPRIAEFTDTKPVVITKAMGPKPPVLSPKPAVVIDKTRGTTSLQQRTVVVAQKPVATPVVVASNTPAVKEEPPVPSSSPDDQVDDVGGSGHGFKIISKTALENIHKESTSVKFNFDEKKEDKSPGTVQSKQVGVIRPQLKSPAIPTEKLILVEDAPPKDSTDSVLKKEELIVAPPVVVTKVRSQKTEFPAQPTTTTTTSPTSASKSQPVAVSTSRSTKQAQQPASGPTVLKPDPVATAAVAAVATTVASPSATPLVEKKAQENPIVVSVPMVKILTSSSSQISKPSNSTLTTNAATTIAAAPSPSNSTTTREQKKQWHSHQSETTTVFNFVNDTSRNTDHIRNEGGSSGILVYKVKMFCFFLFSFLFIEPL